MRTGRWKAPSLAKRRGASPELEHVGLRDLDRSPVLHLHLCNWCTFRKLAPKTLTKGS